MSPARMAGLAWWASGGSVEGRRGHIAAIDAAQLLSFFAQEAEAHAAAGDAGAACYCAEQALELGRALAKAISWRRCAAGG